jgi:sensor histidine kinase YesM
VAASFEEKTNMNTTNNKKWVDLLADPQAKIILALFGWIVYFLFALFIVSASMRSFEDAFTHSAVLTLVTALVIYINSEYLTPRFFAQGRYIPWLVVFLVLNLLGAILLTIFSNNIYPFFSFQRSFITLLMSSFLIFFLQLLLNYLMQYWRWEAKANQLDSEVKLLRAQVNPHFLFNSLNSIYSLSLDKDERTPEVTMKLSQIMRYMVDRAGEDRIKLEEEISYLQDYIDLEKLRLGDKAEISFEVKGNTSLHQVEPLLLIPFVENAVRHGLDTMRSGGYLKAGLQVDHRSITFQCKNAFNPEIKRTSTGTGIANVRKRLEKLYPGRFDLYVHRAENEFTVELKLHLS